MYEVIILKIYPFWKFTNKIFLKRLFCSYVYRNYVSLPFIFLRFPAVLWNCMQPSELWILNPRKLLAKFDQQKCPETELSQVDGVPTTTGLWLSWPSAPCTNQNVNLQAKVLKTTKLSWIKENAGFATTVNVTSPWSNPATVPATFLASIMSVCVDGLWKAARLRTSRCAAKCATTSMKSTKTTSWNGIRRLRPNIGAALPLLWRAFVWRWPVLGLLFSYTIIRIFEC